MGRKRGECGGADSDETIVYLEHSNGYMNPHDKIAHYTHHAHTVTNKCS